MSETASVILRRVVAYDAIGVEVNRKTREDFEGTEVLVVMEDENQKDFFFPDYTGMSDVEMAEVVANNLREELWNSLKL